MKYSNAIPPFLFLLLAMLTRRIISDWILLGKRVSGVSVATSANLLTSKHQSTTWRNHSLCGEKIVFGQGSLGKSKVWEPKAIYKSATTPGERRGDRFLGLLFAILSYQLDHGLPDVRREVHCRLAARCC